MPAKPVQISLDEDLLRRIDEDRETQTLGRSAFIRAAVDAYLTIKRRRQIDEQIARAYEGRGADLLSDATPFVDVQAWPDE